MPLLASGREEQQTGVGGRRRGRRRRRWHPRWRLACGGSGCSRRSTVRRALEHLRASQRPASVARGRGIRPEKHEFEAWGRAHTFSDAPKWPCHRPWGRWQGGRRPPTQRRRSRLLPLSRSSPEPRATERPTGTGPSTCPLHGIGGGVADGAGAHLHRMKAGVDPVLLTCWFDVCAPRWQCRVGMRARQLIR